MERESVELLCRIETEDELDYFVNGGIAVHAAAAGCRLRASSPPSQATCPASTSDWLPMGPVPCMRLYRGACNRRRRIFQRMTCHAGFALRSVRLLLRAGSARVGARRSDCHRAVHQPGCRTSGRRRLLASWRCGRHHRPAVGGYMDWRGWTDTRANPAFTERRKATTGRAALTPTPAHGGQRRSRSWATPAGRE